MKATDRDKIATSGADAETSPHHAGRRTVKRAPPPGASSRATVPPWASTIGFTRLNPGRRPRWERLRRPRRSVGEREAVFRCRLQRGEEVIGRLAESNGVGAILEVQIAVPLGERPGTGCGFRRVGITVMFVWHEPERRGAVGV